MKADCSSCSPQSPQVSSGASNMIPEWEYLVTDAPEDLQATLSDLGKKGWSLITTTPKFIFQRPLVSEQKPKARVGFSVTAEE